MKKIRRKLEKSILPFALAHSLTPSSSFTFKEHQDSFPSDKTTWLI